MPITKTEKEMLRVEFSKVWKDQKMIDYCTNKVAAYAELPDGKIITVDKEQVDTRFCFGESGYDYDEAQDMAAHARKSQEYFKAENMKHFNGWINDLTETVNNGKEGFLSHVLVIKPRNYYSQTDDCKLATIRFFRLSEVIDACGGSVYLEELPGKRVTIYGTEYTIATKEEIQIILAAYKEAAEAHEKKINSYLKRYGMSKVHTWTYWRDA